MDKPSDQPPSDRERWLRETEFRNRELELAEKEQSVRESELELARRRERSERWRNPLTVAVLAAAVAGLLNAYVAWMDSEAQLRLETTKAESARILEVLKIGDPDRSLENLRFLKQLGLVETDPLRQRLDTYVADDNRAPVYISPAAVSAFQREAGMRDDGLAGPLTRQRMREAEAARRRPPPEKGAYRE